MTRKRSLIEREIAKRINKTKSKTQTPEYLKELVANLYPEMEAALSRGCDFEDLAKSISVDGIKITANKLKKYHVENLKNRQIEAVNQEYQVEENQKTKLFFDSQLPAQKVSFEKEENLVATREALESEQDDLSKQFNQW
jgi:hypothetical protein